MKNRFLALVATVIATIAICARSQTPTASFLFGDWKVSSFFHTDNISGMSYPEATHLLGTTVTYSSGTVRFGHQELDKPAYVVKALSQSQFFGEWRFHPSEIKIFWEPIATVEITPPSSSSTDFPCTTIFVIDRDHIAADDNGVFFELERVGSGR